MCAGEHEREREREGSKAIERERESEIEMWEDGRKPGIQHSQQQINHKTHQFMNVQHNRAMRKMISDPKWSNQAKS